MKKLISALAVILGCASGCLAAPGPLTSLHEIRALTNAQASHALPVNFEATITFFRAQPRMLYVQDGDSAIYVYLTKDLPLTLGDRVRVQGVARPSYLPIIESGDITVLHHGTLPTPVPANYSGLVRQEYLCKLVIVRATVLSAALSYNGNVRGTLLHLNTADGPLDASVMNNNDTGLKDLLDAEVEVTGVAGTQLDSKMQKVGIVLHTSSMADVKVLKRASRSPWTLPVTQIDAIFDGYRARDITARVRVQGTITYYQPGTAVVLQNGTKSLWISTQTTDPLQIGDFADATGFPDFHEGFLNLVRGEIQDRQVRAPITPVPATWQELSLSDNVHLGHVYDLVSTEGKVVTEARGPARDEYVLNANGKLFTAIYYHSDKSTLIPLPPMKRVAIGSTVRVSGICVQLSSNPFNGEIPFEILMRSFDDIEVVTGPPLLTVRNMAIVAALLFAFVLVVGIRSLLVERRVRCESAATAYLERRRRRILEEINGTRPLNELIEQITELVSFKLDGAPCWCEITDAGHLGNCPTNLATFRVIQIEIPSHTGPPFGTIYAAFPMRAKYRVEQVEAVSMGAGLASIAVGTRRLYLDLVHRSEFDLLTDIQNRFSMERNLDALITEAKRTGGIFGLIYIDLDGFKQINDKFGHHVGDLYLREAASRMKRQLRPADALARLGGDEFAVLVPILSTRSEVQEIALRLDRCFRSPFTIHRQTLKGSASIGIALYPEDADTRDGLFRFADHAMYTAKHARKAQQRSTAVPPVSKTVSIGGK